MSAEPTRITAEHEAALLTVQTALRAYTEREALERTRAVLNRDADHLVGLTRLVRQDPTAFLNGLAMLGVTEDRVPRSPPHQWAAHLERWRIENEKQTAAATEAIRALGVPRPRALADQIQALPDALRRPLLAKEPAAGRVFAQIAAERARAREDRGR